MTLDAIYGKILALTKEYHFKEPAEWAFESQFPAGDGKRDRFPLPGGIFLQWWLTKRGALIREQLAKMILAFAPHLNGDADSFVDIIDRMLQNNVLDYNLFRADEILIMRATTLFELRALDERQFAEHLWQRMHQALSDSVAKWLVVVPLPRLIAPSTTLGFDGLHLIARQDTGAWETLASRYSDARLWDPRTGVRDAKDWNMFGPALPATWLACEAPGTQRGANDQARRRMRTFLALVFAHAADSTGNVLVKSAATLSRMSTQFPSNGARVSVGQATSSIGELVPPLLVDIEITPAVITSIRQWYTRRDAATDELRKRATVASHFVHYAIIANDVERFVHFFVALDALFGVRGDVENTIVAGAARTFPQDTSWPDRARKLFDLRNELLHGGSSVIEDWADLETYERRFRSEPLKDVATAAFVSLQKFFD